VAFFLSFTGVELHQWIGVIGGLLALYHLLAHWEWVSTVSQRVFRKASAIVQLKFLVDVVMLSGFMLIIATGLVISSWLSINLTNYNGWLGIHILVSIATLFGDDGQSGAALALDIQGGARYFLTIHPFTSQTFEAAGCPG